MPEANTPPVDNGQTPPAEGGQPPTTPPSGLPSDQPTSETFDGFALTDDLKAKFKDGKLNGRFGSVQEVLDKLKEAEDFKANTIRDLKEDGNQQHLQEQLAQTQEATIRELLPEFLQNGMVLTAEMETKATEAKIDIRDLKIGAMELREATQKAHSVVGGQENYNAMLAWGKENMTEPQKKAFDNDVTGNMSEYAIKGLYGEFQEAIRSGKHNPRIQGQPTTSGIKAYADRRELYKDKDYIESPAGGRDTAAQANYRARLRATPDAVIYGR